MLKTGVSSYNEAMAIAFENCQQCVDKMLDSGEKDSNWVMVNAYEDHRAIVNQIRKLKANN